jgi:hypothetical protein
MPRFYSSWDIPLFVALKSAYRYGDMTKIESLQHFGKCPKTSPRWSWMEEIAYRYLRRYKQKILTVDSHKFADIFCDRYRDNRSFRDRIPNPYRSIGYLIPNDKLHMIVATGDDLYSDDDAIRLAARHRQNKLDKLNTKKRQPSADVREAMILIWENEKLLSERKRQNGYK